MGFLFQSHEGEKTSIYTRGLTAFGLSPHLIFAGDVIEDGDTVGGTEEEKIKVYLEKSQLDRSKVLQVDF